MPGNPNDRSTIPSVAGVAAFGARRRRNCLWSVRASLGVDAPDRRIQQQQSRAVIDGCAGEPMSRADLAIRPADYALTASSRVRGPQRLLLEN